MQGLKLGMPYMGNKRNLASRIVDKILQDNPNTKYVYDLFGGGGSISFEFLQRPQIKRVVYNELNKGVVSLLRDIKENGVTDKYFQWIDRETFMKHKGGDDWFGGLCKVVWSFGNGQKAYLFGKDLEDDKRLAHLAVVNKDRDSLKSLGDKLGVEFDDNMFSLENMHDRRMELYRQIKKNKERFELEQLERLQQLEQLEQLQQLERLEISNLSYEEVIIDTPVNETIIYLDPPYKDTAKYAEQLDHDKMYEWIKKSPYKMYLSSYESELECVEVLDHRTTLGSGKKGKSTKERLFINKRLGNEALKLF